MSQTKAPMSASELNEILIALELKRPDLAVLAGSGVRAAKKWVLGESPVPGAVAHLFRLLSDHPELLPEVWANAGLPDGRKSAPRGRPKKEKN